MIRPATAAALLLLLAPRAGAQHVVPAVPAAPFAALSISAQRLRESLASRLDVAAGSAAELLLATGRDRESAVRDSVVTLARQQLGTRYRYGGSHPTRGFDCSGLVQFVLSMLRIDVPRTAWTQSRTGVEVARDTSALRAGDLLTFGGERGVTHIGIYVGDGRFIHASPSGRRVMESSIVKRGSWYARHWLGARRVVASEPVGS